MVITNFILLNVIVGIVLDNFSTVDEADDSTIGIRHFEEFEKAWFEFDVSQSRYMHITLLRRFFEELPTKFKVNILSSNRSVRLDCKIFGCFLDQFITVRKSLEHDMAITTEAVDRISLAFCIGQSKNHRSLMTVSLLWNLGTSLQGCILP